jgi:hypothetical protein
MKRQRARLTRVEREVLRLQVEGREFSPETMRKAKEQAGDDMDNDIACGARWQWLREHGVRLTTDEPKEE